MIYHVSRIKPLSAAKTLAGLYMAWGLFINVFLVIKEPNFIEGMAPFITFLFLTLLFGVVGFLTGGVVAGAYNIIAKSTMGIEIKLESRIERVKTHSD